MDTPEQDTHTPGRRESELLELYADELDAPNHWRDLALEDARETDRVSEVWEARAEAEEEEFAEWEDDAA